MPKIEKCAYMGEVVGRKGCIIFEDSDCTGFNSNCNFYKSRRQHIEDKDRAIDICREKRLCDKCKYRKIPCKKSDEGGKDNG